MSIKVNKLAVITGYNRVPLCVTLSYDTYDTLTVESQALRQAFGNIGLCDRLR